MLQIEYLNNAGNSFTNKSEGRYMIRLVNGSIINKKHGNKKGRYNIVTLEQKKLNNRLVIKIFTLKQLPLKHILKWLVIHKNIVLIIIRVKYDLQKYSIWKICLAMNLATVDITPLITNPHIRHTFFFI